MEQFPKRCSCKGVIATKADWDRLPYVGALQDHVESLELRNHGCGSTLAVVVARQLAPVAA